MLFKRRKKNWIRGTRRSKIIRLRNPFSKSVFLGLLILGLCLLSWGLISLASQSLHDTDAYMVPPLQNTSIELKRPLPMREDSLSELSDESLNVSDSNSFTDPLLYSEGDDLGNLTIPALGLTLPIIEGTSDNSLRIGVGHFAQSVLPGIEDNCVLSGHRDTVFSDLGKVNIGDWLIVKTSAGVFTYAVSGVRIVEKDDRTVIVPTDHAVLTLTTCYPFRYIGNAPQRYVVSADLIKAE